MKRRTWLGILLVALGVAAVLAPFASSWPDGLEKVAETLGFAHRAEIAPLASAPVPDYEMPGVSNSRLATTAAGVVGTLAVFAVVYGLAALLAARRRGDHAPRK